MPSGNLDGLLYQEGPHAALRVDGSRGRLPLRDIWVVMLGVFRALAHLATLRVIRTIPVASDLFQGVS